MDRVRAIGVAGISWVVRDRRRARRRGFSPRLDWLELRTLLAAPPTPAELIAAATAGTSGPIATDGPGEDPPTDDDDRPDKPAPVTGTYLVDGAEVEPGAPKAMTFDEIDQGQADTCVFDASLSAVALTNFNLAGAITIAQQKSPTDIVYDVRLYEPSGGGFAPVEVPVEFNGTILPSDSTSPDPSEFWPTLFQRAYLSLESSTGLDYHSQSVALEALTGVAAPGASAVTPTTLAAWLNAGNPVVTVTTSSGDPYTLDPADGIIGYHAYTVLAVEVGPSGGASGSYITLRNPWGEDPSGTSSTETDGLDDGIIRIPWSTYATYFTSATHALIGGPSINLPQSFLPPAPTFSKPDPGTITVYEGQTVGPLDLSATDTNARGASVAYYLMGTGVGFLSTSGSYSFSPGPNDVGSHTVTVVATVGLRSSTSETFTIDVLPLQPTVGSVSATPTTINADGTDLLTVTACGLSVPAGTLQWVGFSLDRVGGGSGLIHAGLGEGSAASSWSWSGYVGGLTPGTYTLSAFATSTLADGYVTQGPVTTTTITVAPSPDYEPVIGAVTSQIQASPDAPYDKTGLGTTVDASGDVRVFWTALTTPSAQFVREYNAAGQPLTDPVRLAASLTAGNTASFVGLPSGAFDEVYSSGGGIFVQRYSAAGAAVGAAVAVTANIPEPLFEYPTPVAAVDGAGDLLIAWTAGSSAAGLDVYAATLSAAGAVTRAPWLVNADTTGNQRVPSVALDAAGAGVIAWQDDQQDAIEAVKVSGAGLSNVSTDLTVYHDPTAMAEAVSAGVDAAGDINLVYQGLDGIHARRYGADGADSGDRVVYTIAGDPIYSPKVAVNSEGWAFVAWNDTGYGPNGVETLAKLIDPEGDVQSSFLAVPNFAEPDTLTGVAMNDQGAISVEFQQIGQNDANDIVTNFRIYKADMPPVFSSPTYQLTVPLGAAAGTVVGKVQATSPSGDPIDYRDLDSGPFAVDPVTGMVTVADASALKSTAVTNYGLTILADVANPSANFEPTANVSITVVDTNPPKIAAMPNWTIDAGESVVPLIQATDPAGAALTYTASVVGGSATATVDGSYLKVTPAPGYTGTFQVKVAAANGLDSSSTSFSVTVVTPALAPIANLTIGAGAAGVVLPGSDASGAPLTYSATIAGSGTPPAALAIVNNVLTITPTPGFSGSFSVTATVSSGPDSASRTFQVTVVPTTPLFPTTIPAAPFAPASTDPMTAEITGLYNLILGRAPDVAGLAGWVGYLKAGGTLATAASGFLRSTERETNLVESYYRTFLGRAADPAGLSGWVGVLQGGMSEQAVASAFLNSAEFSAGHADNASFAQALYVDVLDRAASSGEVAACSGLLAAGQLSRVQVVAILVGSAEAADDVIEGVYLSVLGRPAGSAEVVACRPFLTSGQLSADALDALAFSSAEYAAHARAGR